MRVFLEGKCINIVQGEFQSRKDGTVWETISYQILSGEGNELMEIETLQDMDRKGNLTVNEKLVAARKSQANVRIKINATVYDREGRKPEIQSRILDVQLIEERKGRQSPDQAGA